MQTITALAILGSMAATAAAEDLAAGTRVRVTGTTGTYAGALVGIDARGVTVRPRDGGEVLVRHADLERLDVSRRPSRRGQGALIGATVGALAGFVLGASTNPDGCDPSGGNFCLFGPGPMFSDGESGSMAAVPGALLGGLVGALVGGERWRQVEDSRVQVGVVAPRRGGLALAVRF